MAVPEHIKDYHNSINDIENEVQEDTDSILNAIDLDELLKNPTMYLTTLGNLFMDKHKEKFGKAFRLGQAHGKKMTADA